MKVTLSIIDRIMQALGPGHNVIITSEVLTGGMLIIATKDQKNTPMRYQQLFTRKEMMDVKYPYQLVDFFIRAAKKSFESLESHE